MQHLLYYLNYLLYSITYPLRMLLYAPQRMFSGMGRLVRISLPARVAIVTAIFLVICVVVTLVVFVNYSDRAYVKAKITWTFILVIGILVVAIPIVLYKALKLWLEGDVSPFPDIDHAWKAGLDELHRQGLSLSEVPLFLVVGTAGEEHEKAVFDASRLSFNMREVPTGPAPLHWYANPDGIYLVCTNASTLTRLATSAKRVAMEERAGRPPVPRPSSDGIRGTISAGESAPAPAAPVSNIRGTMVVGGHNAGPGEDVSVTVSSLKTVFKLDPKEVAEQDRRLEHVCQLIRRARQPLCPINGILTLLPFGLIQRSTPEAIEVQRAAKKDLATMVRVLMLRCPVTAIVVGLEDEDGFQELVRRVGRDRALGQRFGRGFSVQNPPLPERLDALTTHACGSFEDWVYSLFREKGSLSKPGNTKLYYLLCKIRRNVRSRLVNILTAAYAHDPDVDQKTEPLLFSGCYFAASGATEDRQAFIKGVFDKLPEQQEELEWTQAAYAEDQKYQDLSRLVLGLDTLLLGGLIGLIAWILYHRT